MEFRIQHTDQLKDVARNIIPLFRQHEILLLFGQMGAGKTTLVSEIVKQLGSEDHVSSPTFSIVNEYQYSGGKIFHFDLFRLKNKDELLSIGWEEYLYSGEICIIEWPEIAGRFSDDIQCKEVHIEVENNDRIFKINL
jgi:tRNA threonylcarbamoyladenosine biosynthesis protein TsaE